MSVGQACCLDLFPLKPRGIMPLALRSHSARANGQQALSEVWIASLLNLRSPTTGLRCSHTLVPGAEVFSSLFLFQPGPTSNHQFLPSPVSPFPLLRSGSFSPKRPCREQEVSTGAGPWPGCLEVTVPLLPEGGPTVHRRARWAGVSLEAKNTPESNCPKLNQRPPCTCFLEDLRSPRLLLMHWDSRPSRDGVAPTRITFWTGSPMASSASGQGARSSGRVPATVMPYFLLPSCPAPASLATGNPLLQPSPRAF